MVILDLIFKSQNAKITNSASSPSLKESQNVRGKQISISSHFWRGFL